MIDDPLKLLIIRQGTTRMQPDERRYKRIAARLNTLYTDFMLYHKVKAYYEFSRIFYPFREWARSDRRTNSVFPTYLYDGFKWKARRMTAEYMMLCQERLKCKR